MFRRLAIVALAVMAAAPALAGPRLVRSHVTAGVTRSAAAVAAALRANLAAVYGQQAPASTYIGSDYCLACHAPGGAAPDETSWHGTQHAATYIRPMTEWTLVPGKGVLANTLSTATDDFMQGLDFNTISSPFDAYKPNAPKLSVKNGTYTISIGQLDLPVVVMLQWRFDTGVWEQLFAVRIPVSDSPTGKTEAVYSSPLFWASDTGWQAYTPEAFYDASNQPRFTPAATTDAVVANCESHDQNCVGCHATGIRSITQNARGEWVSKAYIATLYRADDPGYFDYNGDGTVQIMNVGCESCHGPGAAHVLGQGDPAKIVNPDRLDTKGANDVCGQCHSVVASTPNGTIGWPYNETTQQSWLPGSGPLENFYTDAEVWWPDGKTGEDTSQDPEFYKSSKPTFQFHPVRCTDCHDPMSATSNPAQVLDQVQNGTTTLTTHVDDDTLCLSCHATHGAGTSADFTNITVAMVADYANNRAAIGAVVSAHTNHPYAPERTMGLSRCTQCHMAKTQGPDASLSLHGHTFEAIPPQKTLVYQDQGGMPSSCALSCHATLVSASLVGSASPGLSSDISTWNKQYDRDLATALMNWYGPNGLWWKLDVTAAGSTSAAAASASVSTAHAARSRCGRRSHR